MADAKCQGERARRWMIVPEATTWLTKWKHMAREVGTADDPPPPPTRTPSYDPPVLVLLPSLYLFLSPHLFPAEWLLIEEGVGCVSTAVNEVINRLWRTAMIP